MELSITQEELSNRVMKITAACLRVVIQTALSEALGPNWIQTYKNDFDKQAIENDAATLGDNVKKIHDFDFQACVKLFVFMPNYRKIVLKKYSLLNSENEIRTLSSSLMFFRNEIAHSGEKNGTPMDTYTYEHGITTMKALVSYFPTVKDPQTHKSFLEELNGLTMDFNKQATTKMYPFAKYPQLQKYSNAEIVNACLVLGIRTDYDNKNRLSFFSFDESGDINRIYRQLSGNQSETQAPRNPVQQLPTMQQMPFQPAAPAKKASHKKIWVLVGTLIVLLVVVVFFLLFRAVGSLLDNFSQSFFGGSPSVENTTPASLTPAQTEDAAQNASGGAADTSEATTAAAAGAGVNQIPQEMRAKVEAVEPRRETLKVGDTHLDNQISFMLESSHSTNMKAYSEDTSIATVDENMIVTAHKKGIVRIVYVYNWVGTETTVIEYVVD